MKNILIACDLDNTLIHSYKHQKDCDICIEKIHDKDQGFINENAFKILSKIKENAEYVPVTTRSIEQYLRIEFDADAKPEHAVTTNGSILLNGMNRDLTWDSESAKTLKEYQKDLDEILLMLEEDDSYIRRRKVDEMYVFAYCKEGVSAEEKVKYYLDKTRLDIEFSGKKIYFLPPEFNKGVALLRLKEYFKPDYVIAAGDSEIDIPMLEGADLAFCKKAVFDQVKNKNKICFDNEIELLEAILKEVSMRKV